MKSIIIALTVSFMLYATFCIIMYATQRRQIYFPTAPSRSSQAESFLLPVTGAKLQIWSLHQECKPAIIYFGGNAEDVALNIAGFTHLLPTYAIYLINYRGYGGSTGKPTESALCDDAVTIFDALADKHRDISVIGRSLGSGVAVHLASLRPVKKLVLVTPFASLIGVAKAHLPFLPVSTLLKERYNSAAKTSEIKAQVLMIIAENDEIIPRKQSDMLLEAFAEKPCEVVIIPGAGHNTLDNFDLYHKTLKRFLDDTI
ncbi:MAG: alpha/beta hydrolase [Pseudomonadota bacterium]|nr:alpha/beta hydrolase [Pseudomonadota bacterium]